MIQLLLIVTVAVTAIAAEPQYYHHPPAGFYPHQPARYYQQQPYYYYQPEEAYPYYYHHQAAPPAPAAVPFSPVKQQYFMPAYNRPNYHQPQQQELLPGDYIKFLGTVKNQQQVSEDDSQCDDETVSSSPAV